MVVKELHEWDLKPKEVVAVQRQLSAAVEVAAIPEKVETVAGVDVGIKDQMATAAVVVMSYPDLALREVQTARQKVDFLYVPGLLSFRECPVVVRAFAQIELTPDLVLVDGQGMAHPRRLGVASHLGLLIERPTVGCAKSRLCGRHQEPGEERGAQAVLEDRGEVIGAVVRTRIRVKPLYISVGHKIALEQAVRYVLACGGKYRLPEPTRLAHQAAAGTLKEAVL